VLAAESVTVSNLLRLNNDGLSQTGLMYAAPVSFDAPLGLLWRLLRAVDNPRETRIISLISTRIGMHVMQSPETSVYGIRRRRCIVSVGGACIVKSGFGAVLSLVGAHFAGDRLAASPPLISRILDNGRRRSNRRRRFALVGLRPLVRRYLCAVPAQAGVGLVCEMCPRLSRVAPHMVRVPLRQPAGAHALATADIACKLRQGVRGVAGRNRVRLCSHNLFRFRGIIIGVITIILGHRAKCARRAWSTYDSFYASTGG